MKYIITILILVLIMVSGCTHQPTNNPTYNNTSINVTYKQVSGNIVHDRIWTVMILDGLDEQWVRHSLLLCPNEFGYVIVPNDPSKYEMVYWNITTQEGALFPKEDYLIIIWDKNYHSHVDWAAITTAPNGRISVAANPTWNEVQMADIITHECSHNVELVYILDDMENHKDDLNLWMLDKGYGTTWDYEGWTPVYCRYVIDKYLHS